MDQERLGELDLNRLIALQTLLETRSISAAGRTLGVPQPTLSYLLGQLREIFSDPLLVRTGNTMVRTSYSEALQIPLASAIQSLRALGQSQEFRPSESQALFRVACTDFVAGMLFPQVTQRMRKESPGLQLVLENWGTRRTDSLGTTELDLGIGTQARVQAGIYQRKLFEDEFVCIASKSNRRAHNRLTPEQFAQLPHMQLNVKASGSGAVDLALEQLGLSRKISLSVAHFWLAADFLRDTDLLLTAPKRLFQILSARHSFLKRVTLPLELAPFHLHLFWHERVHHDPAHMFLRQCILDEVVCL